MDRQIRVMGKAKLSIPPDMTVLEVYLNRRFPTYEETAAGSERETAIVREVVARAGFDPEEIKTTHFSIEDVYDEYMDERLGKWIRNFDGYQYRHTMRLRFQNDNDLLNRLLQEISRSPVAVEFSIGYAVEDEEAVKNDLIAGAVADAREKAKVLAEAAGVAVGELLAVDYTRGDLGLYRDPVGMLKRNMGGDEIFHGIDFRPEEIQVEDTVTVIWGIKDLKRV